MNQFNDEQTQRLIEAGRAAMNISHGVKNILQASRAGQDIMSQALKTGDIDLAKRTWTLLDQNLERITKLILDMLKFTGDHPPQFQPCEFNRLVKSTVETVRSRANQQQIGITEQLDECLQRIPADTEQIQDVIMNLLINALQAVTPNTGRITIQTELDSSSKQAILRISDNGQGIDNLQQIFEPFYSTRTNVGAGLGLAITKKIIASHNGSIEVQSPPGQGATFTIRLPLEQT